MTTRVHQTTEENNMKKKEKEKERVAIKRGKGRTKEMKPRQDTNGERQKRETVREKKWVTEEMEKTYN